jgi:hypothetical protein
MQGLLSGGFADATDVAFPGGLDEYQSVVADRHACIAAFSSVMDIALNC